MALYIILAIIIIILVGIGILFMMRSNKRTMIQTAEDRKVKLNDLTYDESLHKLERLNMTGQTKAEYDALNDSWKSSLNDYLMPVDEKIHEAEVNLDKFKFSQAETDIKDAHEMMDAYESKHLELTEKADKVLQIHNESSQLYDQTKEEHRKLKREVLANRHQYGEAAAPLEKEIEQVEPELALYEELREDGNYRQAHQHIKNLNEDLT
ncbi:septation ring formation regulator EzrA, partial [Staphylococcus agnetis]